ncbi:MAG: glycoside hydrolase family 31 protein [bacterium]|nr:glycoside hydrolase family 31 protein [bacterium]
MRPQSPAPLTVHAVDETIPHRPRIELRGAQGETVHIAVIDRDIFRVALYPDSTPRLDRTWIVSGTDPAPLEGRPRDERLALSPHSQREEPFTVHHEPGALELGNGDVLLHVDLTTFSLSWYAGDPQPFAADLPLDAYSYDAAGRSVSHSLHHRPDEHYYGFGETAGAFDKAGVRLRMSPRDALGYNAETTDPLYKHFPFYITSVPRQRLFYGLLYDNVSETTFDMGKEIDYTRRARHRTWRAEDGDLDYYLIIGRGHLFPVLHNLARLTGFPALPPRWSLGYLGSTMTYTEAPDAQAQLARFAHLCAQHDIPCDGFHLSSGYTTDADGRRMVFTWNRSRVPDPAAMVTHFHDHGIQVIPNVKPHLLGAHPLYDEAAAAGIFIKTPTGIPARSPFWSGGAGTTEPGSLIDFTHPAGFAWWKAHITSALLAYGMDAIWNDNNEFQLTDDAALCDGFGSPINLGQMRPIQTLLMARASYQALAEHAPAQRPFLVSRSGCIGIQRYAQTWSGDNATSWHSLKWNIPMGLSLSVSGQPNTGHDVGGFYGDAPDPELFVRWVQNGIFHPRFCIHSWHTDGSVNEPWMYPEVLPHIRDAIQLRYRLIPYLYHLLVESHRFGTPILRPLVYAFPDDARVRGESFDFMCGGDLLVASIFEPGARTRTVYLPQGTRWCDFYTGTWYDGGQTVTVAAPLERSPLFARDGALIPLGKVMQHTNAEPDDTRTLMLFASQPIIQAYAWAEESPALTPHQAGLECSVTADDARIDVHVTGGLRNRWRQIELVLPPSDQRPVPKAAPLPDWAIWGSLRRRFRLEMQPVFD